MLAVKAVRSAWISQGHNRSVGCLKLSHILCVLLCYIRVDHIYFIVLFLEDLYSVNLNMLVEYSTVFFFG